MFLEEGILGMMIRLFLLSVKSTALRKKSGYKCLICKSKDVHFLRSSGMKEFMCLGDIQGNAEDPG